MEKNKFFIYKNRPLIRKDNVIYYGYMTEEFVAMLTVEEFHDVKDVKVSDRILLQLLSTKADVAPKDVVVKYTVKSTLYEALDIARIWIDRYIKKTAT